MMKAKPYEYISEIYPYLMRSIAYDHWAKYILSLAKLHKLKKPSILELAAGNGAVAANLKKKCPDIIISDNSLEMLKKSDSGILKVCCDMQHLPFKKKFDLIYSTFDSVNYLRRQKDIVQMLREVETLLADEGVFTFDVGLFKNSIKHSRSLNRKGRYQKIKFSQKSSFNQKTGIHRNKFILKLDNGEIVEEIHKQRIYPFEVIFKLIDRTSLYVSECFKAFSFNDAGPDSDRAQFVLRKSSLC